ncbi:TIGR00341 family protein [Bacterioplanoides pacificum]|uniref:TIGR00341 family protein n=1 Tax=Bacterioplanoides pacificum TaxID=1171596 RepID=A0ABV7VMP4_9GAMM
MITIEAIAPLSNEDAIIRIAKQNDATDYWISSHSEKQIAIKILIEKSKSQKILDQLQKVMEGKSNFRVLAYPLEIALPYDRSKGNGTSTVSREALLSELKTQSKLDGHYLMLVFLSTIVAAIGLLENNVAVIIGAMVIAPLLGPNLALSLSTTLGQINGVLSAARTLIVGITTALLISLLIALFYPNIHFTEELLARTSVGLDGLALALASGTAAALSIMTGVSSVLVGVMVAVALLPPTVTIGICLGLGAYPEAMGATQLLIANIASVNLTAQLTMRIKGIKPRDSNKQRTVLLVFVTGAIFWCALIGYLLYQLYR